MSAWIATVFFLSGSAGLVYQVLWMRALGLFFGSDLYGVSIILSRRSTSSPGCFWRRLHS
ncbi:MAG: hypothetical protein O7G30_03865 [Proteobacteria bacterium]|nr:hypothetical protein [Pseudomonadota bacterium]